MQFQGGLTRQRLGHGEASMEACLLVNDADPFLRVRLSSFLQADGFEVLTAADGREGPRMDYEYHPELVILGLVLPDLEERHLRVRLRQLSDLSILTLAEGSAEETTMGCLNAGEAHCLGRPARLRSQRDLGWAQSRNANLGAQIAIGSNQEANDFQKSPERFLPAAIRGMHSPIAGRA